MASFILFSFSFSSSVFVILFFHRLCGVPRLKPGCIHDRMCFSFKVKLNVVDVERRRYDIVNNLDLNFKRETTTKRETIGNDRGVNDCIYSQALQVKVAFFKLFSSWCCIPVDSLV